VRIFGCRNKADEPRSSFSAACLLAERDLRGLDEALLSGGHREERVALVGAADLARPHLDRGVELPAVEQVDHDRSFGELRQGPETHQKTARAALGRAALSGLKGPAIVRLNVDLGHGG